jgi:hypothetical protein
MAIVASWKKCPRFRQAHGGNHGKSLLVKIFDLSGEEFPAIEYRA